MTIMIEVFLCCDSCGAELEPDECLCTSCKAKVRAQSAKDKQQIEQQTEQDYLQLVEVHSKPIYKTWQELPENAEFWTDKDWEPIGLKVGELIFKSDYSSSRYYGICHVQSICHITKTPNPALDEIGQRTFDDFGAALQRGLKDVLLDCQ